MSGHIGRSGARINKRGGGQGMQVAWGTGLQFYSCIHDVGCIKEA